jgi:hypothetical protein
MYRLRVLENRVQRRIIDPKREEGTTSYRKLHSENHHNLYSLQNILDRSDEES